VRELPAGVLTRGGRRREHSFLKGDQQHFDVQSTTPAPIYVLHRKGEMSPVAGQLNIVDMIPGNPG
jgi:hypothetical protein